MDLYERLKALTGGKAFQNRIRGHVAEQRRKMGGGGAGTSIDKKAADKVADEIAARIDKAVYENIRSVRWYANTYGGLCHVHYEGKDEDGSLLYSIVFNHWVLSRESLWPEGYPKGLGNIIALVTHGSRPSRGPVWNSAVGWEHNFRAKLRRGEHRQLAHYRQGEHFYIPAGFTVKPNPFLRDEIERINAEYAQQNVRVTLDEKYYPG